MRLASRRLGSIPKVGAKTLEIMETFTCIVDGHFGIYVPQTFAERFPESVPADHLETLLAGPDGRDEDESEYWDAWDVVLSSAKVGGLPILQGGSGDVFTYDPDKVTDEEIESMY